MSDTTPRRTVTKAQDAQQRILEAVDALFYQEGARAVSVDEVASRAGVNKMAVYRQFANKDELLLRYLQRMDEVFWAYFAAAEAAHPGQPRLQIRQFFVDLAGRAAKPGFRGCPFVNIASEFTDPQHPARKMVADSKARLLARLHQLCQHAQLPPARADALALLIEGAYAASQTYAPQHPVVQAMVETAERMLEG